MSADSSSVPVPAPLPVPSQPELLTDPEQKCVALATVDSSLQPPPLVRSDAVRQRRGSCSFHPMDVDTPQVERKTSSQPVVLAQAPEGSVFEFDCPVCMRDFGLSYRVKVKQSELACGVFRHAIWKHTGRAVNSHESREMCESLFRNGLVFGCAKPFIIRQKPSGDYEAVCATWEDQADE